MNTLHGYIYPTPLFMSNRFIGCVSHNIVRDFFVAPSGFSSFFGVTQHSRSSVRLFLQHSHIGSWRQNKTSCSSLIFRARGCVQGLALGGCYNAGMTLMEIKYELASPLTLEQLTQLSEFANTYGLRKFRLNDAKTELSFEYDASRLRETQVQHVLGQAKIAISKKMN